MDDAYIKKMTDDLLSLNKTKEKTHEFILALSNAKSMLENRIAANMQKAMIDSQIKTMALVIKDILK